MRFFYYFEDMYDKRKIKWMVVEALLFMVAYYLFSLIFDTSFNIVDCVVTAVLATSVASLFWKFPATRKDG